MPSAPKCKAETDVTLTKKSLVLKLRMPYAALDRFLNKRNLKISVVINSSLKT